MTVKDVEGLEFSYTAVRRKKFGTCLFFSTWYFLKKLRCISSYSTFGSLPKIKSLSLLFSCLIMSDFLWTPCRMPGLPVPHYLPKFVQVHIHCTSDSSQPAIHPCKNLHTDIHSSIIDDSQTLKKKKQKNLMAINSWMINKV